MDKRTKILAAILGAVVLYVIVMAIARRPSVQEKLHIGDTIVQRQEELEKLRDVEDRFLAARDQYRALVTRVGRYDADLVRNEVLERFNDLIAKTGLQNCKRTPGRPRTDRKTGVTRITFTITGEGTLQSVVSFLKQAAELPHLLRFRNTTISPAGSSVRDRNKDSMSLHATVEICVLPRHKLAQVELSQLDAQPVSFVRHADLNYTKIWQRKPFSEYEDPTPVIVKRNPAPPTTRTPPPKTRTPPPPRGPTRWSDRDKQRLVMALPVGDGTSPRDAFLIHNAKSRRDEFVTAGSDFDGGTLLLVHQYGAVVERDDKLYFYPLGAKLDEDVELAEAVEFPMLQAAGARLAARRRAARDAAPPNEHEESANPPIEAGDEGEAPVAEAEQAAEAGRGSDQKRDPEAAKTEAAGGEVPGAERPQTPAAQRRGNTARTPARKRSGSSNAARRSTQGTKRATKKTRARGSARRESDE